MEYLSAQTHTLAIFITIVSKINGEKQQLFSKPFPKMPPYYVTQSLMHLECHVETCVFLPFNNGIEFYPPRKIDLFLITL